MTPDRLVEGAIFCSRRERLDAGECAWFAERFGSGEWPGTPDAAANAAGPKVTGWQLASITMRLIVGGGLPVEGNLIGLEAAIEWDGAARVGNILWVRTEILRITRPPTYPNAQLLKLRCSTFVEPERRVQLMTARILVPGAGS